MNFQPPYHVLWDDDKAESNERRHGISFVAATAAFNDPLSETFHDRDHSLSEERWLTIGHDFNGTLIVVIHTCDEHEGGGVNLRIISARKASAWERRGYETGKYSIREPTPLLENLNMNTKNEDMSDELPRDFDFSKGERGKFYRKDAVFHYPVYLHPDVLKFFSARAHEQHVNLEPLLNQILRAEIERIGVGL